MLKKVLALVMCLVLVCGTGLVASAETVDRQSQPRYNYTNIISSTLINSDGKAKCCGIVEGYNGITTKIVLTVTLQKKTLLWWSDVQEWTITANDYFAAITKTVTVDSGTHRVKSVATVYSGTNRETVDCTSKTCTF